MNPLTVAGTELRRDLVAQIEIITLAEFENRLRDKYIYEITSKALSSGLTVPDCVRQSLAQDRLLLIQGYKYFGSGKTFEALKEEDPALYQQLLPVLHFAFQYGVYDLEHNLVQRPKLPKIMIREIKYDGKGLPTFEIYRRYVKIERRPNQVEFALGIFLDEVDPLIRDLVSSLAEKGYKPVCSCQGHPGFGDKGSVACETKLPKDVVEFIQSRGACIDHSRYTDINIEHKNKSPLEFLVVTQTLANELPQIDALRFLDLGSANEFREFYKQV